MRRFSRIVWTGFLVGAWAFQATAEEPTRMERVVVTATKSKTPEKRVTRAVSVIPADQLKLIQGGFASEAFSEVAETLVRRTGGIGRTTAVTVRGASNRQVHVTVDGAHVGSPTLGGFDFNHFTPDNLERMEILRGGGSVLYGSDAMGGVINLETRRGAGPPRFSAVSEYGTLLDTHREVIALQGEQGRWHFSGSAGRIDSDGLSDNDDYQNTNLSTRIGVGLGEEATLDLSLRHIFAITGIDDGAFRPDPNRKNREHTTIGSVKFESPVTEGWSQFMRFSLQDEDFMDHDPSNEGTTQTSSVFLLDTHRYGAEWSNRLEWADWNTTTAGFEFEDREGDNRSFDKAQTTYAGYLQSQFHPTEALTLLTGMRLFRESAYGTDEVFEGSAAYYHAPWNLKLRGGYSQGFRSPSLNELFFPNFGNPNLLPEENETFEVGVDQVLWEERVTWSGTLFRSDYDNLIEFVRVTPTQTQPLNVARSRIRGVELELEVRPVADWILRGSYAHLNHENRDNGDELLRTPNNTVGFSVHHQPAGRWDARLDGTLVGSREESTGGGRRDKTGGYLKLDFLTTFRFNDHWKGHLRVDNLTSETYSEVLGFPAPGTVFTVGVAWEQ